MPQSAKYVLPIFSALAIYAMGDFSVRNGYISIVMEEVQLWRAAAGNDPKRRPDTTGIESLDETLTSMFVFYWPLIEGSFPALSLVFCNCFGSVVVSMVLYSLESVRKGNRSLSLLFSPTLWGMLSVMATLAISAPWYLTLHLVLSATASHPTIENLSIPIDDLWAVIAEVVVGLLLPCLLVGLPERYTEMLFTRQSAIATWQLWPFWSTAVHFVAKKMISASTQNADAKLQREKTRTTFRYVYGFTFAIAAVTHIAAWTVSLSVAYILPVYNTELVSGISSLHPANVFLNTMPWSSVQTNSVGQGTVWLLQWDQFFAAGSMYYWALSLYRSAHASQNKKVDWYSWASKTLFFCLLSGFAGATVQLLWEREEMILETGNKNELKKSR